MSCSNTSPSILAMLGCLLGLTLYLAGDIVSCSNTSPGIRPITSSHTGMFSGFDIVLSRGYSVMLKDKKTVHLSGLY